MQQQDSPGVVVLPPLLYAVALAAVLGLRWLWPLPVAANSATLWLGAALLLFGAGMGVWGSVSLRRAGTNILPSQPTTAIVASGPFRFSRNPLYVGLSLDLVGLSFIFNSLWGFVVLVPVLAVMHFGVILREERYLEAKFGESYRQYCSAVRRYV